MEFTVNTLKAKTLIVSRSLTMHPQSPPLTISRTVLKGSDDLVILGVTFDSKRTFVKHLRSVSRAASQKLGILRKSWQLFHDRSFLEDAFGVVSCSFWSTDLQFGARLPIHTENYLPVQLLVPGSNWGCV